MGDIQSQQVAAFWQSFLASRPAGASRPPQPEAWGFGDSPEMADELGRLVAGGIKTATCSLLWAYEAEREPLPQEGQLDIVLDGRGRPLCIIENTEVIIRPYNQVDAQFAHEEGEGDRSLAYWREVHWRFFGRACEAISRTISEDMPLVCERFRVVYRAGQMRRVEVLAYDPQWPALFRQAADEIAAVFGPALLAIHHIGSTSVPGLAAKPVIDIMPVVRDIEQVDSFNPGMTALGYIARGEWGIPGRRYFRRGEDWDHREHVHVYAADNPEVARHLDFRDYLRSHPDTAAEYGRLKERLARQFPTDIEGYMDGKDRFIRETISAARAWRGSSGAG
jgi:GrpB-like predicted nucleotidyltransferase (UPF0157 family)/uncharacterized protein YhfF